MIIYILFILLVITIGLLYYLNSNKSEKREYFTQETTNNFISPNDFREKIEPTQKVGSSVGFAVVPYPNPGGSSYVLKHTKDGKSNDMYKMEFNLTPGLHYHFRYYYSNSLPVYDNINSVQILYLDGDTTITPEVNVSESKDVGQTNWELRNISFQVPESGTGRTQIILGGVTEKNIFEYFTDLYLVKTSPYLQNFTFTNNLNLFIMGKKSEHNNNNLIKDLSLTGNDLLFEKNVVYQGDQISLNTNSGKIMNAGKIIGPNKFTIVWNVKLDNMTGQQLFMEIKANNKIERGLTINYETGMSATDNKLILDIGRFTYKYKVGIVQRSANYTLTFNDGVVELFVDGVLIEPYERVSVIDEPLLGTCPDGWKLDETTGMCKVVGINPGKCVSTQDFKGYDNNTKRNWSARCEVSWNNCDILKPGETASEKNMNCEMGDNLNFETNNILINPNGTIRGLLTYLLIYNNRIGVEIIEKLPDAIFKFMNVSVETKETVPVWSSLFDGVINRKLDVYGGGFETPLNNMYVNSSLNRLNTLNEKIRGEVEMDYSRMPIVDNKNYGMGQFMGGELCPFLGNIENSPCNNEYCNNTDWSDLGNLKVNKECNEGINEYCRNNTNDPTCIILRQKAIEREELNKKVETFTNCNSCFRR